MRRMPATDRRMSALPVEAAELRRWLVDVALPLWWTTGADRAGGGFHEAINLDGSPAPSPHRARTIARQVYVFGEAGRLGWDGPWREAVAHALDYLRGKFIRSDGTIASVVDLDGQVRDAPFDLYDQAFGLLALATGHRECGEDSAAVATHWRCARRWRSSRIRKADTSRTAVDGCRSAPIRTCIFWKVHWPGSQSMTISDGATWRTTSRTSA